MRKKKILFHSNHSKSYTGFGKNARNILKYLYSTGKYDLVEYCAGVQWSAAEIKRLPWPCYGTLPDDPNALQQLNRDPSLGRAASYGMLQLDRVIEQEKPDVVFEVEDFWAFTVCNIFDKPYYNKLNWIFHTTLDSLPLLPEAVKYADKIKNYYVWSSFAEKELHRLGHKHVKTIHGAFETNKYYRLTNEERIKLRKKFDIPEKAFVLGFIFRNQLRKSLFSALQGFKTFLTDNPNVDAYFILHTNWTEGWDIPRFIEEFGIDKKRILTTYICRQCLSYQIKPFDGAESDCHYCHTPKAQITTNVGAGVSEPQLNEIINLFDVYVHPLTSGAQEMPIQEAKLTECITLVTNYVCGEEGCSPESGGLPLDWAEYREPGTQFIKASTYPSSIAKQLAKVYNMDEKKRRAMGQKARQYVIDNYDVDHVGKKWEEVIDALPFVEYNFSFKGKTKNVDIKIPNIPDDKEWLMFLYKNILEIEDPKEGLDHWLAKLGQGVSRQQIYDYFKSVASQENAKIGQEIKHADFFEPERTEKKLALVLPETIGDVVIATSLLKSARELYEGWRIYFVTQPKYFEILEPLVPNYIDKLVEHRQEYENQLFMEGQNDHKGFVTVCKYLHFPTQRQLNYLNNGEDKIAFKL